MSKKIDFAIVGVQKAATTSLYFMLKQHPGVFLPESKEDNFFVNDQVYSLKNKHLEFQYGAALEQQRLGHVYVNLMYYATVASQRMYEHNPHMKLVVMLRDPIQRAYSAYWYARSRGWETLTFEEALKRERDGYKFKDFAHQSNLTYLEHGHYADQIEIFQKQFGKKALLVKFQEDMRRDSIKVCHDILAFVGIEQVEKFRPVENDKNVASQARFEFLPRIINNPSILKSIYQVAIPYRWRRWLNRGLLWRLERANKLKQDYPEITDSARSFLESYYKPHNEKLKTMLGRSF